MNRFTIPIVVILATLGPAIVALIGICAVFVALVSDTSTGNSIPRIPRVYYYGPAVVPSFFVGLGFRFFT